MRLRHSDPMPAIAIRFKSEAVAVTLPEIELLLTALPELIAAMIEEEKCNASPVKILKKSQDQFVLDKALGSSDDTAK